MILDIIIIMKHYLIIFAMLLLAAFSFAQENISSTGFETEYTIRDSVDNTGNLYISYWGQLPSVMTFVNSDGSVTVCSSDPAKTYIYEYSINLEQKRTLTFENEFNSLGAFTKDNEGNYYFFYARRAVNQNTENMAMVKYSPQGEKLNTYKLIAFALNSFGGIRIPFDAGTCRLELSGTILAVYFAREMFNGHQASYGFILNKDTFERIDIGQVRNDKMVLKGNNIVPYVSHSFNQFILPIESGFVFADHGDAYPRCFTFAKFLNGSVTKTLNAFKFPGATGANATYAEMGSLAKTSSGYIFCGAYGKDKNNSRNIFTMTFDEDLSKCSAPVYLTSYTKNEGHAGHPKLVELEDGRYLLLWEFFSFSTQSANTIGISRTDYLSTYMAVIDEQGSLHDDIHELKGLRLNMNDTLRYNRHNRKVYWAINDSANSIKIYALTPIS